MFNFVPAPSFALGPISIFWYGVLIFVVMFVGYLLVLRRSTLYSIPKHHLENLFLLVVVLGILGARTYHVMLNLSYYSRDWRQVGNLRAGGLAIHGALLFAAAGILLY